MSTVDTDPSKEDSIMDSNTPMSRRELIRVGLVTSAGGALGFALAACSTPTPLANAAPGASAAPGTGASAAANSSDISILNGAIDIENTAIWAYGAAAATGKLDGTDAISMAVKAQALSNQADHKVHAAALSAAVTSLGGTPSAMRSTYDVSSYINNNEGNLNSLANIAKLALALEVDAVLAYGGAFALLSNKDLLKAASQIAPDESAHATAIRALLMQAGVNIGGKIIPAALFSLDTRSAWVLKV